MMDDNPSVEQRNGKSEMTAAIKKRMTQVVVQLLFLAAMLFISAGRLDWVWAWVYLGAGVGILAINVLVVSPELIAERGRIDKENTKSWDIVLTTILQLPVLGIPIVAGLDVRFGWSPPLILAIQVVGLIFMVLGQNLFSWSMASNKFFSTSVRIQADRDHIVAAGGPYRYVRHPGYVGYLIAGLATALLLGSLWALIPAGLAVPLMVVRTALEDRTLHDELNGYKDYAAQVRYRLLPGVW